MLDQTVNKRSEEQLNAMVNPNGSDLTVNGYRLVTVDDLKRDAESIAMLQAANATMKALGYTEHGQRHAGLVGNIAQNVLEHLGYDQRTFQLGNVAGFLHDIGNSIHRQNHALSGSLMAWSILKRMQMSPQECALVMNAIGNHEEERGTATTAISAAVIIGDKADVHRSRVQNPRMEDFDIHDRVNYAAKRSFVRVRPEEKIIALELEIDTYYAAVIEYFEIFLSRMTMMRQACEFLGCKYQLIINDTQFA
ncbi:MAG: phosphohydrolase [Caldilinea sp.]|nr:phosphohydrolase [Caldilinea sp.]MCB0042784.1 phosphohydrolase [Caldilinea sp.]MCW5843841.1 phosphohydrolase [Caldilinea sp.]